MSSRLAFFAVQSRVFKYSYSSRSVKRNSHEHETLFPPRDDQCLAARLRLLSFRLVARAEDWPMWGRTPQRNMVSPERIRRPTGTSRPARTSSGAQRSGSKSYGNPIVANGIVSVGTNNEGHRDPNITADGGVLMAFDANTGKFLWQRYHAKLPTGRVNDWPRRRACAPPPTPSRAGSGTAPIAAKSSAWISAPARQTPGQPPKEIWTRRHDRASSASSRTT